MSEVVAVARISLQEVPGYIRVPGLVNIQKANLNMAIYSGFSNLAMENLSLQVDVPIQTILTIW